MPKPSSTLSHHQTPTLAITLGEPLGIGVEITLKALQSHKPWQQVRTVVIGSLHAWRHDVNGLGFPDLEFQVIESCADLEGPGLYFCNIEGNLKTSPLELTSLERGSLSVRALHELRHLHHLSNLAVVTAPIDKHACHQAGFSFPGQTEYVTALWGGEAIMTLAGPQLKVGLVTNHLSLRDVPAALTIDLVARKIELFYQTLTQVLGIAQPKIAVTGLNPHASDQGLFGNEEAQVITPAIAAARCRVNTEILGPLPADTAFYQGYAGKVDGVLAMYHDQGLGPLKTVHFDNAINISGGLKHLRVSPDHGPARDLYLKGTASSQSMELAVERALYYLTAPKREGHHGSN
jgi:4-hydroxythreonine-4-phosphate dehydrogenase